MLVNFFKNIFNGLIFARYGDGTAIAGCISIGLGYGFTLGFRCSTSYCTCPGATGTISGRGAVIKTDTQKAKRSSMTARSGTAIKMARCVSKAVLKGFGKILTHAFRNSLAIVLTIGELSGSKGRKTRINLLQTSLALLKDFFIQRFSNKHCSVFRTFHGINKFFDALDKAFFIFVSCGRYDRYRRNILTSAKTSTLIYRT